MKMNLQFFGGRSSAGGNAKASAESRAEAKATESLNERVKRVRQQSEQSRIAREAAAEKQKGQRNWNPEVGTRISNVSSERAANELYNAPIGTVITMDNHNTGNYVGEYTRTAEGWVGSQQYRTNRVKPATVKTAKGFAMQVSGNDVKVIKTGSTKQKRKK